MPDTQELESQVLQQLKDTRQAGLATLPSSTQTDLLENAAQTVPGYHPPLTRSAAIKLLLCYEVKLLTDAAYRMWIEDLFNLNDEFMTTSPTELRKKALKRAQQHDNTITKTNFERTGGHQERAFKALAKQIVADCFRGNDPTAKETPDGLDDRPIGRPAAYPPPDHAKTAAPPKVLAVQTLGQSLHGTYIDRLAPEAEVMGHLGQLDVWIVYLHGDAGTGKTRLAEACAARYAKSEKVPVINAADDEQLYEGLKGMLVASGHSSKDLDRYNVKDEAAKLFAGDGWPNVVIFDNVTDINKLAFLPVPSKTKILLTGIEQPPPGYLHAQVRISNMDKPEAEAMVLDRWPGCPESDLPSLLEALGNKPLAIEHACAYLKEPGTTVEGFLVALEKKIAEFMDMIGFPHDRTLTAIYSLLLGRISKHEGALRALDIVVHTYADRLSLPVFAFIWPEEDLEELCGSTSVEISSSARPAGRTAIVTKIHTARQVPPSKAEPGRAALRILEHLNMIEIVDERIVMHGLTWAILRDLRSEAEAVILNRIGKIGATIYAKGSLWSPGHQFPAGNLVWFDYLKLLIIHPLPTKGLHTEIAEDINSFHRGLEALLSDDKFMNAVHSCNDAELAAQLMLYAALLRMGEQLGKPLARILTQAEAVFDMAAERLDSHQGMPLTDLLLGYLDIGLELIDWWIRCSDASVAVQIGLKYHSDLVKRIAAAGLNSYVLKDGDRSYWHLLANHDVEWGLLHQLVSEDKLENERTRLFPRLYSSSQLDDEIRWLNQSAIHAMDAGLIYTHQAKWNDAIAALEHAFSSFMKLAELPHGTYGAAESARRLALAYLRMGRMDDAKGWANRAADVVFYWTQAGVAQLYDVNWSMRLRNTLFEVELTENVRMDARSFFDSEYRKQRLPALNRDLDYTLQQCRHTLEGKVATSVMLNLWRGAHAQLVNIDKGFVAGLLKDIREQDPEDDYPLAYARSDYVAFNQDLCKAPTLVIGIGVAGGLAEFERQKAIERGDSSFTLAEYARGKFAMANRFGELYRLPYWEMRALQHALFLGWIGDAHPKWLSRVERRFIDIAERIGRMDLVERHARFTATPEPPFWMLGF